MNLSLVTPPTSQNPVTIEDRLNGPTTLVLDFDRTITEGTNFAVKLNSGSVSSTSTNGSQLLINLSGAANAQTLVVEVSDVVDASTGGAGGYTFDVGRMDGDVNSSGTVDSADQSLVNDAYNSGVYVTADNFRSDIDGDGIFSGIDSIFEADEVSGDSGVTLAAPIPDSFVPGAHFYATAGQQFTANLGTVNVEASRDPSEYAVSINWGDNTTSAGSIATNAQGLSVVSGTHTYATNTSSPIVVTVSSKSGDVSATNFTVQPIVTVPSVAPILLAVPFGAASARAGRMFDLTLSASYPNGDLSQSLQNWWVDWGDGSADTQLAGNSTTHPGHAYKSPGVYTVSVYATDQYGAYQATPLNVTVTGTGSGPDSLSIAATPISDSEIDLSYSAAGWKNVDIEEAVAGDLTYHAITQFTVLDSTDDPATIAVTGLAPNTHYDFRIRAVASGGTEQYAYAPARTSTTSSLIDSTVLTEDLAGPDIGFVTGGITYGWSQYSGTDNVTYDIQFYTVMSSQDDPLGIAGEGKLTTLQGNIASGELAAAENLDGVAYIDARVITESAIDSNTGNEASPWTTIFANNLQSTGSQAILQAEKPGISNFTVALTGDGSSITVSDGAAPSWITGHVTQGEIYGINPATGQATPITAVAVNPMGFFSRQIEISQLPAGTKELFEVMLPPTSTVNAPISSYSNIVLLPGASVPVPLAPTDLTAIASNPNANTVSVHLAWDNLSNDQSGYTLERISSATASTPFSVNLASDQTAYVDSVPNDGSTYTYQILAFNSGGSSPSVSTQVQTGSLQAPTNVVAQIAGGTAIRLVWDDPSPQVTRYTIEYSMNGVPSGNTTSVPVGTGTQLFENLNTASIYQFEVFANYSGGTSAAAFAASITTGIADTSGWYLVSGVTGDANNGVIPIHQGLSPAIASIGGLNVLNSKPIWADGWQEAVYISLGGSVIANGTFYNFSSGHFMPGLPSQLGAGTALGSNFNSRSLGLAQNLQLVGFNDGTGTGYNSDYFEVQVSQSQAPLAPVGLSVYAVSNTRNDLYWISNSLGFVSSFSIYRSQTSPVLINPSNLIAAVPAGSSFVYSYEDQNHPDDGTSYYEIIADDAGGNWVGQAGPVSAQTGLLPPSNLQAVADPSSGHVQLTWQNNSTTASYTQVQWSTDGTNFTTFATEIPSGTSEFLDTTTSQGTQKYYRVFAVQGVHQSDFSNVATISGPITATISAPGQVTVSWPAAQTSVQGYQVEESTDGADFYDVSNVTSATSLVINGLGASPVYIFRLVTIESNGTQADSQTATVSFTPTVQSMSYSEWPNSVTTTSTELSVAAADPELDSSFTYAWSVIASPPGSQAPTFDSSALQTPTVTFRAAGAYTFQVTATNSAGISASDAIDVTVTQTPTSVEVNEGYVPGSQGGLIPAGGQINLSSNNTELTAIAVDQFGQPMAVQPNPSQWQWSISPTGALAANSNLSGSPATISQEGVITNGTGSYEYEQYAATPIWTSLSGSGGMYASAPPQPPLQPIYVKFTGTETLTSVASPISLNVGQVFSGQLATLQINLQIAGNYHFQRVIINWGDGTTSIGTANYLGGSTVDIDGRHAYSSAGQFNIFVGAADYPTPEVQTPYLSSTTLTAVVASSTDAVATATSEGNINVSWLNDAGTSASYYIYRMGPSDSQYVYLAGPLSAVAGQPLSNFLDTELVPDTQYSYKVYSGAGTDFSYASATTSPSEGYDSTPIQTLSVPITGVGDLVNYPTSFAQGDGVESVTLQPGVHYKIVASGFGELSDGNPKSLVDSQWYYQDSDGNPILIESSAKGIEYGIAINSTDSGPVKFPYWGSYSSTHEYSIDVLGTGQPLSFNFHDDVYPDNYGASNFQVQIFEQVDSPRPTTVGDPIINAGGTPPAPPTYSIDEGNDYSFAASQPDELNYVDGFDFPVSTPANGVLEGASADSDGWTFASTGPGGAAGVSSAGNLTAGNVGTPPTGSQAAFLQGDSWMDQTVYVPYSGTFNLGYALAFAYDPANPTASQEAVYVWLDGKALKGNLSSGDGSGAFLDYSISIPGLSAGYHKLEFRGYIFGQDAAYVTDVTLEPAPSPMGTYNLGIFDYTGGSAYQVERSDAGGPWQILGTMALLSFADTFAIAGVASLYRVIAQALAIGNGQIFMSMAPELSAYLQGGIANITVMQGEGVGVVKPNQIAGWNAIAANNIWPGNESLLQSEQQDILQGPTGIYTLYPNLFSNLTKAFSGSLVVSPIPGNNPSFVTVEGPNVQPGGKFANEPLGLTIGDFNERWDWITAPAPKGLFQDFQNWANANPLLNPLTLVNGDYL